jgi:hypothetical protein
MERMWNRYEIAFVIRNDNVKWATIVLEVQLMGNDYASDIITLLLIK